MSSGGVRTIRGHPIRFGELAGPLVHSTDVFDWRDDAADRKVGDSDAHRTFEESFRVHNHHIEGSELACVEEYPRFADVALESVLADPRAGPGEVADDRQSFRLRPWHRGSDSTVGFDAALSVTTDVQSLIGEANHDRARVLDRWGGPYRRQYAVRVFQPLGESHNLHRRGAGAGRARNLGGRRIIAGGVERRTGGPRAQVLRRGACGYAFH
jgi:hypothetical protein